MVKRAFCVAMGVLSALLPAVAQQGHHSTRHERLQSNSVSNTPLSLTLNRSKNLGAGDGSLLLHNGSVPLWLDGPQVITGFIDPGSFASQWVQMGFTSQNLFPEMSLSASRTSAQTANVGRVHSSDGKDLGVDGKDIGDEMSPLSRVYYGGEIGFLYGRWSGKGGGDMWESYIVGTVGNDKFQITAGASYDEWNPNGRSVRFRSFGAPR